MPVHPSEDGYTIDGLDPPGFDRFPQDVRTMFYGWVLEIGLRQKDRDLAKGLDKDGKPLKAISEYTRKHRKSAMTPSGKGDPSAPPLIPGWQKSRVRSLLTGKAFPDRVEYWWRYDAFLGDSFARILEHQAEHGRDVFGLSPQALARVKAQSWERWEKWRKGTYVEPVKPTVRPGAPIGVGPADKRWTTPMGAGPPIKHPTMTYEDFVKELRRSAPAALPGRPGRPVVKSPIAGPQYNRLLQLIYGKPGQKPPPAYHPPVPKPVKPSPLQQRIAVPKIPQGVFARFLAWFRSA